MHRDRPAIAAAWTPGSHTRGHTGVAGRRAGLGTTRPQSCRCVCLDCWLAPEGRYRRRRTVPGAAIGEGCWVGIHMVPAQHGGRQGHDWRRDQRRHDQTHAAGVLQVEPSSTSTPCGSVHIRQQQAMHMASRQTGSRCGAERATPGPAAAHRKTSPATAAFATKQAQSTAPAAAPAAAPPPSVAVLLRLGGRATSSAWPSCCCACCATGGCCSPAAWHSCSWPG